MSTIVLVLKYVGSATANPTYFKEQNYDYEFVFFQHFICRRRILSLKLRIKQIKKFRH